MNDELTAVDIKKMEEEIRYRSSSCARKFSRTSRPRANSAI